MKQPERKIKKIEVSKSGRQDATSLLEVLAGISLPSLVVAKIYGEYTW